MEQIELWASKLQGDWACTSFGTQINKERLQALLRVPKDKLDNMVKVRMLLACAFMPPAQLAELHPELCSLAAAARTDDDEWVRVVGNAVGDFDGTLDMAGVCSGSALVRATLDGLWSGLGSAKPLPGYRPLQEVLMHPRVRPAPAPSSAVSVSHFTPRDTPEAQEVLAASNPDNLMGPGWGGSAGGAVADASGTPGVHHGTPRGAPPRDSSLYIARPRTGTAGTVGTPRAASVSAAARTQSQQVQPPQADSEAPAEGAGQATDQGYEHGYHQGGQLYDQQDAMEVEGQGREEHGEHTSHGAGGSEGGEAELGEASGQDEELNGPDLKRQRLPDDGEVGSAEDVEQEEI